MRRWLSEEKRAELVIQDLIILLISYITCFYCFECVLLKLHIPSAVIILMAEQILCCGPGTDRERDGGSL